MNNLIAPIIPQNWEEFKLEEILENFNKKVKDSRIDKKKIPVLSMTRYSGLILQEKKFYRRVASENIDNYKVIKKGQICCGFPMDEGVIFTLKNLDIGAVSPAYSIWQIKSEKINTEFLDYLLKSQEW